MKIQIRNSKLSARQAADLFAAEAFEEPRKVGTWIVDSLTPRFRLIGGRQWYEVVLLPGNGWEIESIMLPV